MVLATPPTCANGCPGSGIGTCAATLKAVGTAALAVLLLLLLLLPPRSFFCHRLLLLAFRFSLFASYGGGFGDGDGLSGG